MKSNIDKLILISVGLLRLCTNATGQTKANKPYIFGAFTIVPIEFPIIDTKDINQQLVANGLPAAKYSAANIGIGLQFYSNRMITTLSFNKTTKKENHDTYLTEVEYRSTSFNVGYSLTSSRTFSVYPYVGFKGAGLNYLYREKTPNSTTLGNYLQTNLNYKEITNSRAHLDLGFGIAHQDFYLINFRIGYLLPLEKSKWKINNNQTSLTNTKPLSCQYYFTLTLGLGGLSNDKD
jgi:hypothetical protein